MKLSRYSLTASTRRVGTPRIRAAFACFVGHVLVGAEENAGVLHVLLRQHRFQHLEEEFRALLVCGVIRDGCGGPFPGSTRTPGREHPRKVDRDGIEGSTYVQANPVMSSSSSSVGRRP